MRHAKGIPAFELAGFDGFLSLPTMELRGVIYESVGTGETIGTLLSSDLLGFAIHALPW